MTERVNESMYVILGGRIILWRLGDRESMECLAAFTNPDCITFHLPTVKTGSLAGVLISKLFNDIGRMND